MKNIISFQPNRFDKITFTNKERKQKWIIVSGTFWQKQHSGESIILILNKKITKSNSPIKNLEIKGSKARLDCAFRIKHVWNLIEHYDWDHCSKPPNWINATARRLTIVSLHNLYANANDTMTLFYHNVPALSKPQSLSWQI